MDSGAAVSVLPDKLLPEHPVTAGDAARKNVHYLSADGGRVPNLGETRVHFETKERHRVNHVFQVAEVKKPILSVDSLTKSGNEVRFHTGGGTITNNRTKKQIKFAKKGRGVCA